MISKRAAIRAIASHLPSRKLTNEELAQAYQDWSVDKIFEKTGIAIRGIAEPGECASDLGLLAAQKLFASGVCVPDDIDFILFCSQAPDYFLPATACILQDRLGLKTSCGALDFNLGCSGFVYGLALAKALIENDNANNVLLITAETYSKFIHPQDRSVRTLFGDGAAATLMSARSGEENILGPFVFGTDGRGAGKLIVRAGGCRQPATPETATVSEDSSGNFRSAQNLYMDGPEIFNFTLKVIPRVVNQLLEKSRMQLPDVDYFVFHQANKFMLEQLRKKIRIPEHKFCINMESYGNTVSATIPMALEIARTQKRIKEGDTVMLVGFGVGYSWAAAMIRIDGGGNE
jgi:3-oxoacyl-[acyl-carrier-protein] synthase III